MLDNVGCRLTENRLIDCPGLKGPTAHNCNHGEDAGVICVPAYTPGPGMTELYIIVLCIDAYPPAQSLQM